MSRAKRDGLANMIFNKTANYERGEEKEALSRGAAAKGF